MSATSKSEMRANRGERLRDRRVAVTAGNARAQTGQIFDAGETSDPQEVQNIELPP
jgi:hypothetical protein